MTGGDGFAGWTAYTTEAAAFANTSHVQSAAKCMDLSGFWICCTYFRL